MQAAKSPEKPLPAKGITERTVPPDATYANSGGEKPLFREQIGDYPGKTEERRAAENFREDGFSVRGHGHGRSQEGPDQQSRIRRPHAGKGGSKDKWVAVGDTIGTFSVTDIKKDRIILADGANNHEILLYDKSKPARQTAAAEKSAAPTVVASGPAPAAAATRSDTKPRKPPASPWRKGKARRRLNIESSTHPLDRPSKGYNKPMKQAITIVFCALLFAVSFLAGCAGPAAQTRQTRIDDRSVKADAEGGAKVAGAAEKPVAAEAAEVRRGERGGR